MATQTTHYNLIKPSSADRVAVGDLNDNSDIIDGNLFIANERADQLADDYNPSSTYNTDDYVRRENYLYKCLEDNVTGTWDATKWDRVKVMDEITQGGGGGSSTLAGLDDVNISTPTDGQALVFDNATQKWVNGAGGGGSSTFAGLNDVNVAGVADKDIARFNSSTNKWEKSSDLSDLELSVSQLSSSVLSIAGDVDTLELTVSQMSASTLPYDANTSTKQKIDSVESSIPTSASDLPYSSSKSTKQAIDETVNSLTTKIDYLDLGDVGGGSATDALGKAWDAITTYNKPVVVKYIYNGIWMGMAYKYSGNLYGMMQSMPYHTGNIYLLNVNNGAKTFKTLTGQ
jgi:hypothetical protein